MRNIHDFDEKIDRIGLGSYKWDIEGENSKMIPLGCKMEGMKWIGQFWKLK